MSDFRVDLTKWSEFVLQDQAEASVTTWRGYESLRLNGLAMIPNLSVAEGSIDVQIGSDETSYCGLAFRIADPLNYELAYGQPHTSGRWDALQYDPVFRGINTWQIYHGTGAQQAVEVPKGDWFHLRVDFKDQRAVIQLNDQPPLVVPQLAHAHNKGLIGLWSYKPAYFRDLRISDTSRSTDLDFIETNQPMPEGVITEWFLHDYGRVACEENGNFNLHRFLPASVSEARLTRKFALDKESTVTLKFGFSDEIHIFIDGEIVFEGEKKFKVSPEWNDQGYVSLSNELSLPLSSGIHLMDIRLKRTEMFGFGFCLSLLNGQYDLLSCDIGG